MTDAVLTTKRIDVLKRHKCVISPHTGDCWQCRALKRYEEEAEWKRNHRGGGGRKAQRTSVHLSPERDIERASASYHRRKKVTK